MGRIAEVCGDEVLMRQLSFSSVGFDRFGKTTRRRFVGIDLGREPAPDETTILNFRHLKKSWKIQASRVANATTPGPADAWRIVHLWISDLISDIRNSWDVQNSTVFGAQIRPL